MLYFGVSFSSYVAFLFLLKPLYSLLDFLRIAIIQLLS